MTDRSAALRRKDKGGCFCSLMRTELLHLEKKNIILFESMSAKLTPCNETSQVCSDAVREKGGGVKALPLWGGKLKIQGGLFIISSSFFPTFTTYFWLSVFLFI